MFPKSLKSLKFGRAVSYSLKANALNLPESLEVLDFSYLPAVRSLQSIRIHEGLKEFHFPRHDNHDTDFSFLPSSTEHIHLSSRIRINSDTRENLNFRDRFPNLKSLSLGRRFNQSLVGMRVGESFETLTLSSSLRWYNVNEEGVKVWNQHVIPVGVKTLRLEMMGFNASIQYPIFPEGLEVLELHLCHSTANAFTNFMVPSTLQRVYIHRRSILNGIRFPDNVEVIITRSDPRITNSMTYGVEEVINTSEEEEEEE
jgi:hypothetical protein